MARDGSTRRKLTGWRLIGLWLMLLAIFDLLLIFVPHYSPLATILAALITALALIAIVPLAFGMEKTWWRDLMASNVFLLYFLSFAGRFFLAIWPNPVAVSLLLIVPYTLSWLLPGLAPRLSAFLFREQLAPDTRFGQGCLSVSLAILPAAGVMGAYIQMYGPRYFGDDLFYSLAGLLSALVSIGWAQTTAYQLWPQRPWARKENP
jgi:hypothetical protein